jgi:hypothetical protein
MENSDYRVDIEEYIPFLLALSNEKLHRSPIAGRRCVEPATSRLREVLSNIHEGERDLSNRRTLEGSLFASSAFFRSSRRTLASDPGSDTNRPSPFRMEKVLDPVSSVFDGPNSTRNFAVLPCEVYVAANANDPLPPSKSSILKPTDPGEATYASSGRPCTAVIRWLQSMVASSKAARKQTEWRCIAGC